MLSPHFFKEPFDFWKDSLLMACSNRQASFSAVLGSTPASIKRSVKNGVFHKSFQLFPSLFLLSEYICRYP